MLDAVSDYFCNKVWLLFTSKTYARHILVSTNLKEKKIAVCALNLHRDNLNGAYLSECTTSFISSKGVLPSIT